MNVHGIYHGMVAATALAVFSMICWPSSAADLDRVYESAQHLRASTWVLSSPYDHLHVALVDTDTGRVDPVEIGGLSWVTALTAIAEGRANDWLYALDLRNDGRVLVKVPLPAGGTAQVMRRYPADGEGALESWLRQGPDGTLLLAARRQGQWIIDVMNPVSEAVERQIGPLAACPLDAVLLASGQWLILDGERLWTWPDGETLLYSDAGAPLIWDDPPPMLRGSWPEYIVVLPDGGLVLGSTWSLTLVDGAIEQHIAGSGRGLLYPAEAGKARHAAVQFLGRPALVAARGNRVFVWDKGGQRILRLDAPAPPPRGNFAWNLTTVWGLPPEQPGPEVVDEAWLRSAFEAPGAGWLVDLRPWLDRLDELAAMDPDPAWLAGQIDTEQYVSWERQVLASSLLQRLGHAPPMAPAAPPQTVDEVLDDWRADPWADWEGITVARFLIDHRAEMFVLVSRRDEAVPRLLDLDGPRAALALAVLRAEEAEPRLREMVMDHSQYSWESGCTFPRSTVGATAWEHLGQAPLGDLLHLTGAERAAMRRALAGAAGAEAMETTCGELGFARHLQGWMEDGR